MNPTASIEKSILVSSSSKGGHGRGDRFTCLMIGVISNVSTVAALDIKNQCWDLHGCPLDLTPCSSPCGGFGNGRGGGCPGGKQLSGHSVTSTSTKLSTMPSVSTPLASYDVDVLSNDKIAAFKHFVS